MPIENATSGVAPELSENLNVAFSASIPPPAVALAGGFSSRSIAMVFPPAVAVVFTTSKRRVFARETPLDAMSCRIQIASSKSMRLGIRLNTYCFAGTVMNSLNNSERVDFLGMDDPFFIEREMNR